VDEEKGRTTEEWNDGPNKKDNNREDSNNVEDEEVEADNDLECEADNTEKVDNAGKCAEETSISTVKGDVMLGLHREQFVACTRSVARGHVRREKDKAEVVGDNKAFRVSDKSTLTGLGERSS
jgi:hypothetical protein